MLNDPNEQVAESTEQTAEVAQEVATEETATEQTQEAGASEVAE
jgi:hypothetical protein